jgi:acyl-CoA reductase-like NAD-dependent aldehyde dehydrogenase
MAETIECVSPVDGQVYASRRVASKKEIAAAFAAAHAAQVQWKRLPIAERAAYCSAAVDAMIAMREEIVPELAWQMGRRCAMAAESCGGSRNGPGT